MMEIYTPKEWLSIFGDPSIVIDDNGYIYSAREYKNLLRTPIGRIDYSRNNIYGKDYASWTASPIAYLVKSGDVTKVYEYGKSQFSDPILYIQGEKIYTPQEYTRWFGGNPSGYIKTDDKTKFDDVLNKSGKGSSNISGGSSGGHSSGGGSSGGNAPMPGCVGALGLPILVGIIYLLSSEKRVANATTFIAIAVNVGAVIYFLLRLAQGKIHFAWDGKRFAKNLAIGIGVYVGATAIFVLLGLGSNLGTGHSISDSGGDQMELAAMFLGVPFVINGLFAEGPKSGTAKTQKSGSQTYTPPKTSTPKAAPQSAYRPAPKPTPKSQPKPTPTPTPKPTPKPAPQAQTGGTKIDMCPRCRAQIRVPVGKGWIQVTCPKCGTSFRMES